MSDNPTTETCPVSVYPPGVPWRGHRCGKPIKRNGKCGVHAAADERRARNEAEREAQRAANNNRRDRAYRGAEKLRAAGIASANVTSGGYGTVWYSVTVDPNEVLRVIGGGEST